MISGVDSTLDAMRGAARSLSSVTASTFTSAEALQTSTNATTAQTALALAEIDELKQHEQLGFSSVVTYARVRMGLSPRTARSLVRIGRMFASLSAVREAALAGELSFDHLLSFDYAVRVGDRDTAVESEAALLTVATNASAEEFHALVRTMNEAIPDELDEAWRRGMDKSDISLAKTLEGWHLAGFLSIELGVKLKTILDSLAIPREEGDRRAPSERRLAGLEALCDTVLEHGLPTDNGHRPQLHVVLDANDDTAAAKLEKFGPIGPALVQHLACHSELTRVTVRNRQVLDVGRTHRYATRRQVVAIRHQQDNTCAAPGCRHSIGHVHHREPWSVGGATDLNNLVGLCNRCHTLVHQGRLKLEPRTE